MYQLVLLIKEIPEDKITLLFYLLADVIYTIVTEIISLATVNQQDEMQVVGKAALAMLIILKFITLLIFPGLVHVVIYHYFIGEKARKKRITLFHALLVILQVIGILLFTYGDNISNITLMYGEVLGCDSHCIENNRVAAPIAIGLSLFIFHILPQGFHNVCKECEESSNTKLSSYRLFENTHWFYALEMLIIIIKIDTLYTVITITTQIDRFCNSIDERLSIGFLTISCLLGAIHMIVNGKYSHIDLQGKSRSVYSITVLILAIVCLPLYLLAGNQQPLDCSFGCDMFVTDQTTTQFSNITRNDQACNRRGNDITRLVLMIVVLLLMSIIIAEFIIGMCRKKKKSNKEYICPLNK